jgi:hypothetical protein
VSCAMPFHAATFRVQVVHQAYPGTIMEDRRPIENNALLLFYEKRESGDVAPHGAGPAVATPEKPTAPAQGALEAVPSAELVVKPSGGSEELLGAGDRDAGVSTAIVLAATERKVFEMSEYVARQAFRFDEEMFSSSVEFCHIRRCAWGALGACQGVSCTHMPTRKPCVRVSEAPVMISSRP